MRWLRRLAAPLVVTSFVAIAIVAVRSAQLPNDRLVSTTDFTITSSITAQPACKSAALLYPGVTRCLTYTVHNSLSVPITVTSLSLALNPADTVPPSCPVASLSLAHTGFSGSFVVPAKGSANSPAGTSIALTDTGQKQDGCKSVTFFFSYSGTAHYTEVFSTNTALSSSVNPSTFGQSVTFTATVTPNGTPPSGPTGAVTFKDGSTVLRTVPLAANGTAQLSTSSLAVGVHSITAVYSNSDGNFSASTSNPLPQRVDGTHVDTVSLSSSANPSKPGQSVTLTTTIQTPPNPNGAPTGTVTFYDGATALATVKVNAKGQSGVAVLTTSSLSTASHTIRAVYSGDTTYRPAQSNTVNQLVTSGTTPNGH